VRVARDAGARVEAELRSHERASIGDAPRWSALSG
jgi:hypothetical protein